MNWKERLYEEKPFLVPNGGDLLKVEITFADWLWLENFIEGLLAPRNLGSLGGKASAAKLTKAQRKARATKASHSRSKKPPKQSLTI